MRACSLRSSNPSIDASWAAAAAAATGDLGDQVGGEIATMSLRALGSLLGRRFSPRGIPRERVQAQAETLGLALHRPLRPLHTLRDLDVVDGAIGAIGALAAAGGIAALIGLLYGDESVTDMKRRPPVDDPAIRAKFMDADGKFAWVQYRDYINFLMWHPEITDHDEMIRRMFPRGPTQETVETEELEGMSVDETAMKARFEEWMKQFGRTYKNEEEKAMRYEIFKKSAIHCDKVNAKPNRSSTRRALNDLADWTFEELYGPGHPEDDSYWEEYFNEYFDHVRHMYAEGRIQGYPRTLEADQKVGWTDAAKQWYKKLKAKKAELDTATNAEQAGATTKTKGGC